MFSRIHVALVAEALALAGALGAVVAFFFGIEATRPLPFATSNDGWSYFLPLIHAHTDALLAGTPLRMVWDLGDGWNPWQSGQIGLLYLPLHLANLMARATGEPLALLDASALLALLGTALVAFWLAPRTLTLAARVGLALALAFAPGVFQVGLIWHNYLIGTPWFVGLCFLIVRNLDRQPSWPRGDRLLCGAFCALLFLSSHVQMYAIGVSMLGALIVVASPSRRALTRSLAMLAFAQLPVLPALIYFKGLSEAVVGSWISRRADPDFFAYQAAGLREVMEGLLAGNFLRGTLLGLSPTRMGMFFNPALIAVIALCVQRRQWRMVAYAVLVIMILAASDFPFVSYLAVGPFDGFRWTWKLTIFTFALFLIWLVRELSVMDRAKRWLPGGLLVMATVSAAICLRGSFVTSWDGVQHLGVRAVMDAGEACMRDARIARGTRLAFVGQFNHQQLGKYPLPILALGGDAPLLFHAESVHLYEPLEPADAHARHLGLSAYWRRSVSPEEWKNNRAQTSERLIAAGAQVLLAAEPGVLDGPHVRTCVDALGRKTWVESLPSGPAHSYPWATVGEYIVELEPLPGGRLLTSVPTTVPPQVQSSRRVSWERYQYGRWIGTPKTIASRWVTWTLLCTMLACYLLWRGRLEIRISID